MAGFNTDKDRKVIPRWRTFDATLRYGELDSITPPPSRVHQQTTADFFAPKIRDWQDHHTVGHASDLVGSALTLGREAEREVSKAARFLLKDDLNVSPWARELAERALKIPNNTETVSTPLPLDKRVLHERVKTFRHLLRTEPKDPVTWVELSHTYAILGLKEKAKRSMIVALQLAMNNRFVLRSASRLWIHLGDPERAHDIIVRADRTHHDPWLLAAEIAIGSIAGRKPRFVKVARRILTERRFSSVHISELASALATLELGAGSTKKSKRLFEISLEDPTENSVAQAAWASRNYKEIRIEDQYLEFPDTFEARSWSFYYQSQWKRVIDECQRWQCDQPFSSRPSAHGSYVAGTALEDYNKSKMFAEQGLIANPSDFTLLNNLAFALMNLGDIKKGEEVLSKAAYLQNSDQDRVVLQATQGFLAFQTGKVAVGRQLYSDARLKAKKMKNSRLFALAFGFQAIEEISRGISDARSILSEVFHALRRETDPIFRVLESRLTKMISKKSKNTRNKQ